MFKDRVKRRVNHLDPENPQLLMESRKLKHNKLSWYEYFTAENI